MLTWHLLICWATALSRHRDSSPAGAQPRLAKFRGQGAGGDKGSLGPLVEQQYVLMKKDLLDIEAALGADAGDASRATSLRRRAWRALVKAQTALSW